MSADAIGDSLVGETIILRSEKTSGPRPKSEYLEYDDTDTTRRYRAEVEEINAWLARAPIAIDEGVLFRSASVDINRRKLRRIFSNGDFTSGGRLFGGFWLDLKKEERLDGLTINDEPVVSLDFGQMNVRLAYARAKVQPPTGDLYSIPGLENNRDGVKSFFNAMLSADRPIKRKPGDMVDLLPKEMTARRIREAVTQAHPDIAHLFGQGIGLHLMFIESEIMVRTLLSLKKEGVVALPIHDSVVVGRSHEGKARDATLLSRPTRVWRPSSR